MEAVEVKDQNDRTWRVFKVNSERVEGEGYLVEVASYGNTHCTCHAFVMGARRPCKHINLVMEGINKETAKALETGKDDLLDTLMDNVLEYARPQPDPNDKCTIDHRHYSKCREAMKASILKWTHQFMSKPQEVVKKED